MACLLRNDSLKRQYKIKCNIGHGAFGYVKLAQHRFTGAQVAIKSIENIKKHIRIITAEMATLQSLQHPNIIRLFQIITTQKHCYFVTEYAPGGNLFQLIKKGGRLQEVRAQKLFGQLVSAIRYCHQIDIVHRDLKPQNILIDAEGNVKVADFGLARRCRAGTVLQGRCGTNIFNAPELVLREGYDGKKADVWSLGVVLYFITIGYHPFKGSTLKETEGNIIQGSYFVPAHVSAQLENLIHQLLTIAPEKRPSIEDVEQHPWVIKCEENIPGNTYPDPKVLDILIDLGFNINDILESLQKRKYDEMMGTYLIIEEQVRKGVWLDCTTLPKPEYTDPTPPPTPVPCLKRRASEPIFGFLPSQPLQQNQPDILTLLERKLARSASLPQCCPQRKIPPCSCAPLYKPGAHPCISSSIPEEIMSLPPKLDFDMEAISPPQNTGCFKRLHRRIRTCLSCCCLPRSSETQPPPMFNRVAP
ncbi:putative sperm motility kinase W [Phodopus roborovskii]|uniref:non-specific serine/threonine protein kinase n=1 Tax=Phodopus roborovskii TaxID=109678 RepID=A0AAU9ZVE9_PHORO|nr:putative sperm motility kinase W [Phodopus roborovskii]CAH6884927.1 LOC102555239 [Phodopus roborovskii]